MGIRKGGIFILKKHGGNFFSEDVAHALADGAGLIVYHYHYTYKVVSDMIRLLLGCFVIRVWRHLLVAFLISLVVSCLVAYIAYVASFYILMLLLSYSCILMR